MTTSRSATGPAEARHHIANLLHTYTGIADRKDVPAVLDLLGDTVVTFPTDGYADRADAAGFFGRLWAGDTPHRHEVSNLVVVPAADGGGRRPRTTRATCSPPARCSRPSASTP